MAVGRVSLLRKYGWGGQPLGLRPDVEIARNLGCGLDEVVEARRLLKIPPCQKRSFARRDIDWDALPLGRVHDIVIAREAGVTEARIAQVRAERGIPLQVHLRRRNKIDWSRYPLGKVPDTQVALMAGTSVVTVFRARARLGIDACTPYRRIDIDWDALPLGVRTDASIAREVGCSLGAVAYQRRKRGIPRAPRSKHRVGDHSRRAAADWDSVPLGDAPDEEIAERLGVSRAAVGQQRRRRGIPPVNAPNKGGRNK